MIGPKLCLLQLFRKRTFDGDFEVAFGASFGHVGDAAFSGDGDAKF